MTETFMSIGCLCRDTAWCKPQQQHKTTSGGSFCQIRYIAAAHSLILYNLLKLGCNLLARFAQFGRPDTAPLVLWMWSPIWQIAWETTHSQPRSPAGQLSCL